MPGQARDTGRVSERPTNRLAGEASPYLLQHAHNPVDWYPWGAEALERARAAAAATRPLPVKLPRYRRLLQLG